jgi:S1-C subfamily serine protease
MIFMRLLVWTAIIVVVVSCSTCGGGEMSIQDKMEQMYFASVRISTENGSGSGTVFDTHGGYSVIITARHVIEDAKKIRVRFYPSEAEYTAVITKIYEQGDLAFLMVKHVHEYVANHGRPFELQVFMKTYKIGSALGSFMPRATEGIVSEVDTDYNYFITSSPVIYGDSGGGIYVEDGGKFVLVGVTVALPLAQGHFPVYHIGYVIDMFALQDFLKE